MLPSNTVYDANERVTLRIKSVDLPTTVIASINDGIHNEFYMSLKKVLDEVVSVKNMFNHLTAKSENTAKIAN